MAAGRRWGEGVTKKREAKKSRQLWTGRGRALPGAGGVYRAVLLGTGGRQRR
jgi:hypothetical protein